MTYDCTLTNISLFSTINDIDIVKEKFVELSFRGVYLLENCILTHYCSLTNITFFFKQKIIKRQLNTKSCSKKIYDFEKCHTSKTPNPLSGRNALEKEECIKKGTKRYQKIKPTIYELLR